MNRKQFLFTAVLTATFCLAAQTDWNAAGDAWWKHVEYLASDDLQGRNVGSPGFAKAADYVAEQFRKAGLRPAGTDGYFQAVAFTEASVDLNSSKLSLIRNGKTEAVDVPGEATLSYSAHSAKSLTAPVVFAGHGLVIPEANYDDLKGSDVRGAIVAFLAGGPDSIDGNLRAHYSSMEVGWKALERAGAIGWLVIPDPKTMNIPWERQAQAYGMPQMALTDQAAGGNLKDKFGAVWNPARADDLLAGSGHTFAEIVDAAHAQKPLPHFALPVQVKVELAVATRPLASKNVIGVYPGVDDSLRNQYVVISAHLDHLGTGKPVNGDSIYNGAMDDASGIASLIEIAAALHQSHAQPKRSVAFVAVTGEEKGELGSTYFAAYPTVKGPIVADLNMDMYLPLFPLKWLEVQGLNESTLGDDIRAVASEAGVKVQADKEPNRRRFISSDQYSFIKKGVPALAFKFGYEPGDPEEKIFKDWYAQRYHGVKDDLSQPVDKAAAAQFNAILQNLALRVADASSKPGWREQSFFKRFAQAGK